MDTTYYLSIKSTSLAHYIQKAIILPSRFYHNRADDIQNLFGDYLFLSKTPYVNDSDCSIELVLTENEISNLKKFDNDDNIMLFDKPLPISRIKHIYFCVDDKRKLTLGNINEGAGFVNEKVVKILPKTDECIQNIKTPEIEQFKYSKELESKIKDFDQKLGGVAFVRFNTNNKHSKDYFSTLSFFNDYIKEEYEKNSNQKVSTKYHGAFSYSGSWEKLAPLIYEPITEEDIYTTAEKNGIKITKDLAGNFEFTKIDSNTNTYNLAILCTYGSSSTKRKSIDNLVSSLMDGKISSDKQEGISLIFGINNGYSVFRNQYKEKIVKFKMDSILDYYTVESIFQCVIYDESKCERFKYLDKIISKKPFIDDLYFKTYLIMDETIVTDEKTVISEIKESVSSGILDSSLFTKIESFVGNLLKNKEALSDEKNKVTEQLEQKKEENTSLNQKNIELEKKAKEAKNKFEDEKIKVEKLNSEIEKIQEKNLMLLNQKEETIDLKTKLETQKDNLDLTNMNKNELQFKLKEQGIKYLKKDTKAQLRDKLNQSLLL